MKCLGSLKTVEANRSQRFSCVSVIKFSCLPPSSRSGFGFLTWLYFGPKSEIVTSQYYIVIPCALL